MLKSKFTFIQESSSDIEQHLEYISIFVPSLERHSQPDDNWGQSQLDAFQFKFINESGNWKKTKQHSIDSYFLVFKRKA